ncbi:MAG: DUF1269 domain-containing protein [Solirubrobacteraceae bacterium]
MSKPMFFFVGVYQDVQSAESDYASIKALHSADIIGSYDSAVISRKPDGTVKVDKTEKPTQHGGWIGLAAGAAIAVAAPVAMPALVAAGGAGLGAWIGHVARGMNRDDLKEIGQTLDEGTAALIVVGVDKDAERVEKAAEKAAKFTTKRVQGDYEDAERDALDTIGSYDKAA